MDDIDRTFLKLKRKPFNDVLNDLKFLGKVELRMDPGTFQPVARIQKAHLDEAGWPEAEVISLLEYDGHQAVLHRDIYRITYQ